MKMTRVFFSALTAFALSVGTALAQVNINHAMALAGGVTPGDAAGYPVKITQSGHYKLTGNLSVPAGISGIQITADNVTLDLNGYTIGSSGFCQFNETTWHFSCSHVGMSGQGVVITGQNATVRKGTVRGFSIGLMMVFGNQTLEGLTVSSNWDKGINISNQTGFTRISDCLVELNGQGIQVKRGLIERTLVVRIGNGGGIFGTVIDGMRQVLVSESVVVQTGGIGLAFVAVRGTLTHNFEEVLSLGGNVNGGIPF